MKIITGLFTRTFSHAELSYVTFKCTLAGILKSRVNVYHITIQGQSAAYVKLNS